MEQPINMTAALQALAPLLNNPRRTVIQAEAYTSAVMALLLLQLILGSFRRQTSSAWVQAGTWVTYTLSFPAIAYTLGMMQSSPVKNVMYPIWAVSLTLAAGCTNAVKVYELGENKQWKRILFNNCQYFVYSAMIFLLLSPGRLNFKENFKYTYNKGLVPSAFGQLKSPVMVPAFLYSIIFFTTLVGRDAACLFVDLGYADVRKVSKFMNNLLRANDEGFDPVTLKGCRYPVYFINYTAGFKWYLAHFVGINRAFPADDPAITIDQIWQCEGRLLLGSSSNDHSSKRLKDVCLAYAMYQLLKRRYYGMACAEENLPQSRDFVLKGLLGGTEDDYERAFRIVEVELGFCHDYFFTKHAIIFEQQKYFLYSFVARICLILVVAYFVWVNILSVKTLSAIIEVHSTRADNIVTVIVLGIMLLIELLQAAFYMASDWCKVSIACMYVARSWYQGNAFFETLMGCLCRFTIFRHWKNRIDQYSVLSKLTAADMADEGDLQAVKLAIVKTLRLCDGLPTNGVGLLRNSRNGVLPDFSWALKDRTQAEIMLVWHIATEHVNTKFGTEEATESRRVSVILSRYCAYLMNSAPELLPGYFGDARFVIRELKTQDGLQDREEDKSILMDGTKLGEQLKGMVDSADPWKVLADFWTEKILYVAPSDNVKEHMERLANGGEFLTHIWVLLTHAGIHKINREEDRNPKPSQQSQSSV